MQLIDSYNRRFSYLRLSITDVCNFRCSYCLPDGYQCNSQTGFLQLPEIAAVVRAFALCGTRKIRLTGGEPTLRKDLPAIIAQCKNTPGIDQVALTTNGYRLRHQLASFLDAGLDALNISVDSLDPQSFQMITGHRKLGDILKAIDMALADGRTTVKLNAVLMREHNAHQLDQFLDFVRDTPITLRFIELMQTGDNGDFFRQQHTSGEQLMTQLLEQGWQQLERLPHAGPAIELSHPDYLGRIGLIMPYSKDFCSSCNRLRVSAQGNLHLCLFADSNASLRPHLLRESPAELAARLQQLVLGKAASHELHRGFSGMTTQLAMLGG